MFYFQAFDSSVREIAMRIENNFYNLKKENEGIKCGGGNSNNEISSLNLHSSNLVVKKKKKCC